MSQTLKSEGQTYPGKCQWILYAKGNCFIRTGDSKPHNTTEKCQLGHNFIWPGLQLLSEVLKQFTVNYTGNMLYTFTQPK